MSLIELTSTMTENESRAVQNSNNGFLSGTVPPFATQAEAEAGTDNTKIMSPLRVWQAIKKAITSIIYPVGTIRFSADNVNPGTYLGGTWVQYGQGRVPVGVGSIAANTDTSEGSVTAGSINKTSAGILGGEIKHTQTENELFRHAHNMYNYNANGSGSVTTNNNDKVGQAGLAVDVNTDGYKTMWAILHQYKTGGGQPFNIMQPYFTCYIWRRTA